MYAINGIDKIQNSVHQIHGIFIFLSSVLSLFTPLPPSELLQLSSPAFKKPQLSPFISSQVERIKGSFFVVQKI